jgi:HAD superfamily hydrolase (TIGR01509 family)
MIVALIFDVDGTLAETEEAHRVSFNAAFADAGLDWAWSQSDYQNLLRITGGKERMLHYIESCGAALPPGERDNAIHALHRRKTRLYAARVAAGDVPLRPGIETLLRTARDYGFKLAIATTTSRSNVDALLATNLGQDAVDWFSAIVCGDMVARKKPAPDVYEEALRILRLRPDETIAIEDSWNGVQAARSAGIAVVATPSLYSADDDVSDAAAVVTDSLCFHAILGLARKLRGERAGAGLVHPDARNAGEALKEAGS